MNFGPSIIEHKHFKKASQGFHDKVKRLNEKNLSDYVWFSDDSFEDDPDEGNDNAYAPPTHNNPLGVTTRKPKIYSSDTFFNWLNRSKLPSNKIKIRL